MQQESGNKLHVYLDIDGTLLYEPKEGVGDEALDYQFLCEGIEELLEFVCAHCQPFWLSYRARLGYTKALEEHLFPYLPPLARTIPPAYWNDFKYEGVNVEMPFLWFEDDIESEDRAWLETHNWLDSFVPLDPYNPQNPFLILAAIQRHLLSG